MPDRLAAGKPLKGILPKLKKIVLRKTFLAGQNRGKLFCIGRMIAVRFSIFMFQKFEFSGHPVIYGIDKV